MKYSVVVDNGSNSSVLDEYDFVAGTSHYYFYQPHTQINSITLKQLERLFNGWREAVYYDYPDFAWNQLCKFPYLKKSLAQEKELRFPLTFFNDQLRCGAGRYFTIYKFFPHMRMDAFCIYDYHLYQWPRPAIIDINMVLLENMEDLQSMLLKSRNFIREMAAQDCRLNFHLDRNDTIVSSDISDSTGKRFPFVDDSAADPGLIEEIREIIKTTADQPIFSVIERISQLEI